MATIIDVAKKAGVSIKTVSRVMNNEGRVRAETRRKVRQAMNQLDYTPSAAARQMRSGKSTAIGMLYSDPSSGYHARLNHAMMQACGDAGRYLTVGLFDEAKRGWRDQLEAFLDRTKVGSIVLVPPMCDSAVLQDCLSERDIEYVLLSPSRPKRGVASIAMDDKLAAREITEYLLGLGHHRIGHLSGHPDHVASLLRREGFEEAVAAADGKGRCEAMVCEGRFDFRRGLEQAEKMLTADERPTAIFAASDDMAAAIYMAAGRLGLSVPKDISVAGFDGAPIAEVIWPSLTTVAQPYEGMAQAAVRILSGAEPAQDENSGASTIIVPHQIIFRNSCARPPRIRR